MTSIAAMRRLSLPMIRRCAMMSAQVLRQVEEDLRVLLARGTMLMMRSSDSAQLLACSVASYQVAGAGPGGWPRPWPSLSRIFADEDSRFRGGAHHASAARSA